MKKIFSIVFTFIIFLFACGPKATEEAPVVIFDSLNILQPKEHLPELPSFKGRFNEDSAMGLIFQNFDPKENLSIWEVDSLLAEKFLRKADSGKKLFARTHTQHFFYFDTIPAYSLSFASSLVKTPKGPCLAGIAVFIKDEDKWELQALTKALGLFGDEGKLPPFALVKFGNVHHGFLMEYFNEDEDVFSEGFVLFAPRNMKVVPLLTLSTGEKKLDNWGMEEYQYSSQYHFVPSAEKDIFDLYIHTKGTRPLPIDPDMLEYFEQERVFRFEKNKYLMVSESFIRKENPGKNQFEIF